MLQVLQMLQVQVTAVAEAERERAGAQALARLLLSASVFVLLYQSSKLSEEQALLYLRLLLARRKQHDLKR